MSLPQPLPDLVPVPSPRRRPRPAQPGFKARSPLAGRRSSRSAAQAHRALAWEMTIRLTVNLGISLVALATLVRLVPYHQVQRQTLQKVQAAVAESEVTMAQLQAEFDRYFDPAQASRMMQAQDGQRLGRSIPIVLVDPLAPRATEGPASNTDN